MAPSEWGPGLGHMMVFLSERTKVVFHALNWGRRVGGGAGVVEEKLRVVCRTPAPDFQPSRAGGGSVTDDFVEVIRRTARLRLTL